MLLELWAVVGPPMRGEEERAGVRDGRGQLEEKPPAEGSEGVFPFTFPGLRASQRASGV